MKSFKEVFYKNKTLREVLSAIKKKSPKRGPSLETTGITSPSYTGDRNYINQPPVGNPPNAQSYTVDSRS